MKRRIFNISALSLAAIPHMAMAQEDSKYTDGIHYVSLPNKLPTKAAKGKVEVIEFFSLLCIHCYELEPKIQAWMKTADKRLDIKKMHIAFDARTSTMQKLFYTLKSMGLAEKYTQDLLDVTFKLRQPIKDEQDMLDWCRSRSINTKDFYAHLHSFSVANECKMVEKLTNDYGVDATPTMGVAGQFFIPAQGEKMFDIAQYLALQYK